MVEEGNDDQLQLRHFMQLYTTRTKDLAILVSDLFFFGKGSYNDVAVITLRSLMMNDVCYMISDE